MTEELKVITGEVLWFAMFASPLFTIPFVWRMFEIRKVYRVLIGLVLAFMISFLLYYISLAILFRNGMGPV